METFRFISLPIPNSRSYYCSRATLKGQGHQRHGRAARRGKKCVCGCRTLSHQQANYTAPKSEEMKRQQTDFLNHFQHTLWDKRRPAQGAYSLPGLSPRATYHATPNSSTAAAAPTAGSHDGPSTRKRTTTFDTKLFNNTADISATRSSLGW